MKKRRLVLAFVAIAVLGILAFRGARLLGFSTPYILSHVLPLPRFKGEVTFAGDDMPSLSGVTATEGYRVSVHGDTLKITRYKGEYGPYSCRLTFADGSSLTIRGFQSNDWQLTRFTLTAGEGAYSGKTRYLFDSGWEENPVGGTLADRIIEL